MPEAIIEEEVEVVSQDEGKNDPKDDKTGTPESYTPSQRQIIKTHQKDLEFSKVKDKKNNQIRTSRSTCRCQTTF